MLVNQGHQDGALLRRDRLPCAVAGQADVAAVPSVAAGNAASHGVGLGQMNLSGYLAPQRIHYGSEKSDDFTNALYPQHSITSLACRKDPTARLRPVNWNRVPDGKDLEVWNRFTANFWLPEKVPLSTDIPAWQRMRPEERTLTTRVVTGLTMLDTVQATVGGSAGSRAPARSTRRRRTRTLPSCSPCTRADAGVDVRAAGDALGARAAVLGALYEPLGLMEDVAVFVRYNNANKALMNLGYPERFPAEKTRVNPEILAALSPGSDENHDFFSSPGSSYVMGKGEDITDADWEV